MPGLCRCTLPAQLTQDIQLLRQSLDTSFCLRNTLEQETRLGDRHVGLPEGSFLQGSGQEHRQTALPGPGLPGSPWERGCRQRLMAPRYAERHRHSAIFRAPTAKHSSFPRHFPSRGFSHLCNYPQIKIKGISHTSESLRLSAGFSFPTPTHSSLPPGRFPFLAVTPRRSGPWTAAGCSATS